MASLLIYDRIDGVSLGGQWNIYRSGDLFNCPGYRMREGEDKWWYKENSLISLTLTKTGKWRADDSNKFPTVRQGLALVQSSGMMGF